MARADTILAAVQRIHEVPLTPDGWTHALPSIAEAIRSQRVCMFARSMSRTVDFITGFGFAPEYVAHYAALVSTSKVPPSLLTMPAGATVRSSTILPDREFARSVVYNEFVRPIGAFYGTITTLSRTHEREITFMAGRVLGEEDYDAEDVAAMQILIPHLVTAMRVSDRLEAADLCAAGAWAALDRLEAGVIIVDAANRVLFANRRAETVLAGNDGLGTGEDGLRASDPNAARALRRAIAACASDVPINGSADSTIDILREDGRAPLRVLVAPLRADVVQIDMTWLGAARPVAILLVTDPLQEQHARREDLRLRFELTATEADVALEILKGDGRDAAAARLGISMTTVRTHLSHIFEKTGVHRQAELVRLLMQGRLPGG